MSLIICPECSQSISDRAHCCPSCGCPVSMSLRRIITDIPPVWRTVLYMLSLVFLIGGGYLTGIAVFLNSCEEFGQLLFGLILLCQGSLNLWLLRRYHKSVKEIAIKTL